MQARNYVLTRRLSMARGSSYGEDSPLPPAPVTPQTNIPRRATRELPAINDEAEQATGVVPARQTGIKTHHDEGKHPLARHRRSINHLLISMLCLLLLAFRA